MSGKRQELAREIEALTKLAYDISIDITRIKTDPSLTAQERSDKIGVARAAEAKVGRDLAAKQLELAVFKK